MSKISAPFKIKKHHGDFLSILGPCEFETFLLCRGALKKNEMKACNSQIVKQVWLLSFLYELSNLFWHFTAYHLGLYLLLLESYIIMFLYCPFKLYSIILSSSRGYENLAVPKIVIKRQTWNVEWLLNRRWKICKSKVKIQREKWELIQWENNWKAQTFDVFVQIYSTI